jgi:alpha-galactosidase
MLTRCFMNGRPFEADPDCLMLRASETKLNRDETRTLASGVAVFGGALLISDDLGGWGPEQETMAARLIPRVSAKPRCPDLWRNEVPRFMVSRLEDPFGEYRLVWVINWAGKKRDIEVKMNELGLEAGRYHACEFWSARYLGEFRDSFLLEGLPPHGSAVVRLTPEGEGPLMLGSNVHISQGAAELSGAERTENGVNLTLRSPVLPMRKAIIVLRLPERLRTAPPDVDVSDLGGSVFRLEFKLQGVRELNLWW